MFFGMQNYELWHIYLELLKYSFIMEWEKLKEFLIHLDNRFGNKYR